MTQDATETPAVIGPSEDGWRAESLPDYPGMWSVISPKGEAEAAFTDEPTAHRLVFGPADDGATDFECHVSALFEGPTPFGCAAIEGRLARLFGQTIGYWRERVTARLLPAAPAGPPEPITPKALEALGGRQGPSPWSYWFGWSPGPVVVLFQPLAGSTSWRACVDVTQLPDQHHLAGVRDLLRTLGLSSGDGFGPHVSGPPQPARVVGGYTSATPPLEEAGDA